MLARNLQFPIDRSDFCPLAPRLQRCGHSAINNKSPIAALRIRGTWPAPTSERWIGSGKVAGTAVQLSCCPRHGNVSANHGSTSVRTAGIIWIFGKPGYVTKTLRLSHTHYEASRTSQRCLWNSPIQPPGLIFPEVFALERTIGKLTGVDFFQDIYRMQSRHWIKCPFAENVDMIFRL